jgi:hypothetical protein
MAAYWPWPIRVGSNEPYPFVLRDAAGERLDLTGVQVRLTFGWPGKQVIYASGRDAEITIPDQSGDTVGEVHVRLSLAFTRTLPAGRLASYEMELRGLLEAEQETVALYGPLDVAGGLNPDGVVA